MTQPTRYLVFIPSPKETELLDLKAKLGDSSILYGNLDGRSYMFVINVDNDWVTDFFKDKDALRRRSLIFELQ